MPAWWRLRTHAYLVLGVLLFLIIFLGFYALSEAKRHAIEADELLNANVKAASIVRQIETARSDEVRTAAKFRVTGDPAYQSVSKQQRSAVADLLSELRVTIGEDPFLIPVIGQLEKSHAVPAFGTELRELERRLEAQRSEKVNRIRLVARDLGKLILVALVVAIGVTSWLAVMLYQAVLKPLESIKRAAGRIREGELSYRVEKFRGFSELTALRIEFNAMASKLEELDRMKADFLSTVSHELKTPLTAIKEGLNLLTEKQESLPPHLMVRTLDVCNQAVKRLETMIQNLLNHAKMESGFYLFDERPKNFIATIESAIQGIKPIAERRKMVIELRVQTKHHHAAFSTEGITHAIENLLFNAVKYGDNSAPIVVEVRRIRPGAQSSLPQLEVIVTNRGKGLLPGEIKQVFERFFRASNADGQKGVGLGLSVVKRIIEAHHGSVSAESLGGVDSVTTFSFRIPQKYESEAAPSVAGMPQHGEALI